MKIDEKRFAHRLILHLHELPKTRIDTPRPFREDHSMVNGPHHNAEWEQSLFVRPRKNEFHPVLQGRTTKMPRCAPSLFLGAHLRLEPFRASF